MKIIPNRIQNLQKALKALYFGGFLYAKVFIDIRKF